MFICMPCTVVSKMTFLGSAPRAIDQASTCVGGLLEHYRQTVGKEN